jgi:hypothetical protein
VARLPAEVGQRLPVDRGNRLEPFPGRLVGPERRSQEALGEFGVAAVERDLPFHPVPPAPVGLGIEIVQAFGLLRAREHRLQREVIPL